MKRNINVYYKYVVYFKFYIYFKFTIYYPFLQSDHLSCGRSYFFSTANSPYYRKLQLSGVPVPPYAVMKGNEMHGVDVDIWNTAAKARGLTVTYVPEASFEDILDKVKKYIYTQISLIKKYTLDLNLQYAQFPEKISLSRD